MASGRRGISSQKDPRTCMMLGWGGRLVNDGPTGKMFLFNRVTIRLR